MDAHMCGSLRNTDNCKKKKNSCNVVWMGNLSYVIW